MNTKHTTAIFAVLMLTVLCASAYVSVPTITDGIGFEYQNITIGDDRIQIGNTNITKEATFVVAASDSLHKEGADFICDGVDDQDTINSIISSASQGDKILFMDGTFHISAPINVTKAVTLEGIGHGWEYAGTFFTLDAGSNCSMFVVDSLGGSHIFFFTLKNMMLDGNKIAQGEGLSAGIYLKSDLSDSMITNVGITEFQDYGIYITAGWLHSFTNVWAEYCGNGAQINTGNPKFMNCHFGWNVDYGIHSGAGLQMCNSKVTQSGKAGIFLQSNSQPATIVGCSIGANNQLGGTYGGLMTNGDANVIVGNTFRQEETEDYAIKLYAASTNNTITGNNFIDYDTPVIKESGANIGGFVRHNGGYITENSGTTTLVSGTTSIAVPHGLDVTPAAGDIMGTAIESLGSASFFWIDMYTSTTFNVTVNADPTQDVDFAWNSAVY